VKEAVVNVEALDAEEEDEFPDLDLDIVNKKTKEMLEKYPHEAANIDKALRSTHLLPWFFIRPNKH